VGGFVMSRMSQMIKTTTGSFNSAFILAAILLLIGAVLTLTLKDPNAVTVPEGAIFEPELGLTMADGGEKIDKKSGKVCSKGEKN